MRYGILQMFVLYPFIVNLISLVAGVILYFLQKFLKRRRQE